MKALRILAISAALLAPGAAFAETINLDMTTLPSAQGWTYVARGNDAAVEEPTIYSVSGGLLHLDTLGIGLSENGGTFYTRSVGLTSTEDWTMSMEVALGASEDLLGGGVAYPCGIAFGGGSSIVVGFGGSYVEYRTAAGAMNAVDLPTGFDQSAFNTYRFVARGGNRQSFYINDMPVFVDQAFSGGLTADGNPGSIFFGDVSGIGNGQTEIRAFSFSSGAVPEPAAWAMMLLGFGGLGAVLRRRRGLALAA